MRFGEACPSLEKVRLVKEFVWRRDIKGEGFGDWYQCEDVDGEGRLAVVSDLEDGKIGNLSYY